MNLQSRKHMAEGDGGGGGGGGGGGAPWYGELKADAPAEFKTWITNKNFADPQTALLSQFNQEKLLGADKAARAVIWPKDENDKDGWKAVNAKLGVPEKPEGYGFTKAEADADDGLIKFASGAFHARGVPKAAAAGLLEDMRKYGGELRTAAEAAAKAKGEAELTALTTEWGTSAAANTEAARRFAQTLGITQEQMTAVEGALGTSTFLKMFHAGGQKLGEHGGGGNANAGGNATQQQAREKIDTARQQRSEGKLSEKDYLAVIDQYGPIATPTAAAA